MEDTTVTEMQTSLSKIEEINSPPIVGEKYLVLCLQDSANEQKTPWIPIRGIAHTDHDIFPGDVIHYHVDWRFAGMSVFKYFEINPYHIDDLLESPLSIVPVDARSQALKYLSRKCLYSDLEVPYPKSSVDKILGSKYFGRRYKLTFRDELYKKYKGQTMRRDCCPHFNYNLASVPTDERGRKVCPLHGLTIGSRGKVIRPI